MPKRGTGKYAYQQCILKTCGRRYDLGEILHSCPVCGNILDVCYEWERLPLPKRLSDFERRWRNRRDPLDVSGVWRFRELLPFASRRYIVSVGEGQTLLRRSDGLSKYVGMAKGRLFLQYEGMNPSGSFKDNGMTAAFTHAKMVGVKSAACASTGNTSASLALFAAESGMLSAFVFVGSGRIAYGKLSQALEHGARTLQIDGDFDDAMARVQEVCTAKKIYLVNSLNPFRLEGQKAIMYRVLEGLGWNVPDWIVVPGGNLGNSSAFGKAFFELRELGLIKKIPRLAVINSTGANTLYTLFTKRRLRWNEGLVNDDLIRKYYDEMDRKGLRARTIASAIEINRPVNLKKALRALDIMKGVVAQVTDEEILDAKAQLGRHGLGCEPASAASLAGARKLIRSGVIAKSERVVCILTGNVLKDPNASVNYHSLSQREIARKYRAYGVKNNRFANRPIPVKNDFDAIVKAMALR